MDTFRPALMRGPGRGHRPGAFAHGRISPRPGNISPLDTFHPLMECVVLVASEYSKVPIL